MHACMEMHEWIYMNGMVVGGYKVGRWDPQGRRRDDSRRACEWVPRVTSCTVGSSAPSLCSFAAPRPVIAARHVTISLTLVLESHGSRSSDGGELLSLWSDGWCNNISNNHIRTSKRVHYLLIFLVILNFSMKLCFKRPPNFCSD